MPAAPRFPSRETAAPKLLVPQLLSWFAQNARDLPWRKTRDPYAIWVSEIMLQQTQVKTALPYWQRWMQRLPTIESVTRARAATIHKLWEGLGYYTRARNLQKAAQLIVEQHGGRFPERFEEVLSLPGIGRYTAGAICSIAYNQPTPILDGNVIRVLTRIFGIKSNPREKATNNRLWELATNLVTAAQLNESRNTNHATRSPTATLANTPCSHLNQALMELGALICTPRQPKCTACPVSKNCVALNLNRIELFPNTGPRATSTARRFAAVILENDGKLLVRQRPPGGVNAELWEFPNAEFSASLPDIRAVARHLLGSNPRTLRPVCTIKHSITRYRITLEAVALEIAPPAPIQNLKGRWLPIEALDKLPFPSAHRQILERWKKLSGERWGVSSCKLQVSS